MLHVNIKCFEAPVDKNIAVASFFIQGYAYMILKINFLCTPCPGDFCVAVF